MALFGIVQGSVYPDLRQMSAELTKAHDLPGIAIGGVSVGETHTQMMDAVDHAEPFLPTHKPRYLMGVGFPEDLVEAAARGIDMFDCVLPSRFGRSGVIFTRRGKFRVTKGKFKILSGLGIGLSLLFLDRRNNLLKTPNLTTIAVIDLNRNRNLCNIGVI